ncbi:hypothetical protein [Halogeometricum pallidum]|uniref:hypothetical protein n=1 Tax=Halogeometricum pallidum TaxID=411361 RepID=UPI0012683F12|nr:hypothetical protein [Halogeometricum pallidum]
MARQDKLSPYWIRLRPKIERGYSLSNSNAEYFDLLSLDKENEGFDGFPTFAHFLLTRLVHLQDNGVVRGTTEKTLTVRALNDAGPGSDLSTSHGYTIEAVFGYGKYGRPRDHVDSEELEKPDTDPDEVIEEDAQNSVTSPEDRLYALFHFPGPTTDRGIAIFHKYGNVSVKSSLYSFLNEKLVQLYVETPGEKTKGIKFEMNTVASKPLADQLLEDDIMGFELVQRKVPSDPYANQSDPLGGTRDAKFTFTAETDNLDISREGIENLLSRIGNNDYPYAEIFERFDEGDYHIDDISAIVNNSNDNKRKRKLTRSKLTSEMYISTDINYDEETNRPIPASIGFLARDFANEQLEAYNYELLDENQSLLQPEHLGIDEEPAEEVVQD